MVTDTDNSNDASGSKRAARHPFQRAILRGLAVLLPPLFTILIFIWVINMTNTYMLAPVTDGVRELAVMVESNILEEQDLPADQRGKTKPVVGKEPFQKLGDDKFIPQSVYKVVQEDVRSTGGEQPKTAKDFYRRWVDLTILRWYFIIPFFLALLTLLLYLLGKFMAARIGRYFGSHFERGIHRLPVVRTVYSSVKQVSDFLFTEREIEYTRVVAVQYPRKGIFSLGFVTGESMAQLREAAGEPVLSVLMATSPMPLTGFTVTVRKSETVDLNITIDQAFQFIVSCGVVIPPQQLQQMQSTPDALPVPNRSDESDQGSGFGIQGSEPRVSRLTENPEP